MSAKIERNKPMRKVVLIAVGVAGLLIVLSLLAFSAYAVHTVAASSATSSINVLSSPAQSDTSAATDDSTLIDMSSNANGGVNLSPHQIGRECDGSATTDNAADVGY